MLPITIVFIGVLLIVQTAMAIHVGVNRTRLKIDFGDGDDMTMHRSIRAHGNFSEYVPFVLLGMGAAEISGAPATLIWIAGGLLVVARLAHAAFMYDIMGTMGRGLGAGLTSLSSVVLGVYLIGHFAGIFV